MTIRLHDYMTLCDYTILCDATPETSFIYRFHLCLFCPNDVEIWQKRN